MSNDKPQFTRCITEYIGKGEPCPCHPDESEIALEVMRRTVRLLMERAIKQLARELIDNKLVLSEEIITTK